MSNLTDALIAAKLVGGSGGSGGGSGLPEITPGSQTVVFAEQSVSFSEGQDGLYSAMLQFVTIASGVTYNVTWDGTTYTCVGSEISMGGQTGIVAGNLSIDGPGEDTGEPFVFVHVSSMNGTNVATTTAGPHTIGVTTSTPQTPPDGYVLGVDGGEWKAVPSGGEESGGGGGSASSSLEVVISAGKGGSFSCDKTYAEILEAIDANIPIDATVFAGTHVLSKIHFYYYSASRVRFFYFEYNGAGLKVTQLELNSSDEITATYMIASGTWENV